MKKILIIVENLPVPFDRRVWQEATTLVEAGYQVSVICPKGKGFVSSHEVLEGVHIYRHPRLPKSKGASGYPLEYSLSLFWQFLLAWKVYFQRGFDAIQACNPPDLIVLVAMFFKLIGKKFVFDHHDINPELYEAKFGRRDTFYRLLLAFEKLTFRMADVSIATNESYKKIAINRGGMSPDKVFVVRSGPDLTKFTSTSTSRCRNGNDELIIGYVGIMGSQDGVDGLLRIARCIVDKAGVKRVKFLLIGEGPELGALKRQAESLDLGGSVEFTGYLSGQVLLDRLSEIDIGVVPDLNNDYNDKCTMNKIMEYMAMSKPLVQYDLTEGRYSAQNASLYAQNNDEQMFAEKLIELIGDADLRARLGKIGFERIRNELDWQFEVPKLLKAYATIFK